MKKTDKISYRQKAIGELEKLQSDKRKLLVETKAQFITGQKKDSSVFKKMKYELSLISTLITEKQKESKNE
jgi:ribosomal protein L29